MMGSVCPAPDSAIDGSEAIPMPEVFSFWIPGSGQKQGGVSTAAAWGLQG